MAGRSTDRETYGHFMLAKSNQIGEQTVETDCREGYCGRAEGAEQPGVEATGVYLFVL